MDLQAWKLFQPLSPAFLADVRMAAVIGKGESGILVLKNNTVFTVGSGPLLGVGGCTFSSVPTKIAQLSGSRLKGIFSGTNFAIVLNEHGAIFVWGENEFGEQGLGPHFLPVREPTRIELPNDELVAQVACGTRHALVLTDSGKLYGWGWNMFEQICEGGAAHTIWTPVEVAIAEAVSKDVLSVACNSSSSFVLTNGGQVWTWGTAASIISQGRTSGAVQFPLEEHISKIVCGEDNALVLAHSGNIYIWGKYGDDWRRQFTRVEGLQRVKDIAATIHGSLNVCIEQSGGTYLWGDWLGHYWEVPTSVSVTSMDQVFAMHGGLMCRPVDRLPSQHGGVLSNALSQCFNEPKFADVILQIGGDLTINAHSVILASMSTFFAAYLDTHWENSSFNSIREIEIREVDPDVFKSFLYYLYTEKIDCYLPDGRPAHYTWVLELLKTADQFGQMELLGQCKQVLMSIISPENASDVLSTARQLNMEDLEKRATELLTP